MKKMLKCCQTLAIVGLLAGLVACSNAANGNSFASDMDANSISYSNEYLELCVQKNPAAAKKVYYSSREIKRFNLVVDFKDSSIQDLSAPLDPTDTYTFNVFKSCSVTIEITGFNVDGKKIAYGEKDFDFTVGNDVSVVVPVDMLIKSSAVTVGIKVNDKSDLAEDLLSNYNEGTFYRYWFSDLGLTSLQDYLERGHDLAYFQSTSGVKVMIDRPYGDEDPTVVALDAKGNFWVFNTDGEDCSVKIKVGDVEKTLTQGLYKYDTLYIYDTNGWAHNTWSVSELKESND